MSVLILDHYEATKYLHLRQASGLDQHDEVWNGVKIIMPLPNVEHQQIVQGFSFVMQTIFGWQSPYILLPGANVSDRVTDWTDNYREPDFLIFAPGNTAINCETHWCGGPDFLLEVVSVGDQCRDKLGFYASIQTQEVLIIDREPWQLELYRLQQGNMVLVGQSDLNQPVQLSSTVLPVQFCLVTGSSRPMIQVSHTNSNQFWLV